MLPEITDCEFRAAIFPAFPFGPVTDEREDQQRDQIHFLFGQATLWAQAYEDGMACFISAAEALEAKRKNIGANPKADSGSYAKRVSPVLPTARFPQRANGSRTEDEEPSCT